MTLSQKRTKNGPKGAKNSVFGDQDITFFCKSKSSEIGTPRSWKNQSNSFWLVPIVPSVCSYVNEGSSQKSHQDIRSTCVLYRGQYLMPLSLNCLPISFFELFANIICDPLVGNCILQPVVTWLKTVPRSSTTSQIYTLQHIFSLSHFSATHFLIFSSLMENGSRSSKTFCNIPYQLHQSPYFLIFVTSPRARLV